MSRLPRHQPVNFRHRASKAMLRPRTLAAPPSSARTVQPDAITVSPMSVAVRGNDVVINLVKKMDARRELYENVAEHFEYFMEGLTEFVVAKLVRKEVPATPADVSALAASIDAIAVGVGGVGGGMTPAQMLSARGAAAMKANALAADLKLRKADLQEVLESPRDQNGCIIYFDAKTKGFFVHEWIGMDSVRKDVSVRIEWKPSPGGKCTATWPTGFIPLLITMALPILRAVTAGSRSRGR